MSIRRAIAFKRRLAFSFIGSYPLEAPIYPLNALLSRNPVQKSSADGAFPACTSAGLCFPIFSVFSRADSYREWRQARGLNEISETGTDRHRGQRPVVRPVGHERVERLRRC